MTEQRVGLSLGDLNGAVLSYVWAAMLLVIVLVTLAVVSDAVAKKMNVADRLGLWPVVLGKDKRISTSKLQMFLWTVLIVTAVGAMVIMGKGADIESQFQPQYLALLGIPAAGAAGAKLITSTKVASGTIDKPDAPATAGAPTRPGPAEALQQSVGDDEGNIDLGDLQYLLFNLLGIAYFIIALCKDPQHLPVLPDTLVGLTGASAAGYLGKKAVADYTPVITGLIPGSAAPGETVTISGANFIGPSAGPPGKDDPSRGVQVTFGGVRAPVVDATIPDAITATVPDGVPPGATNLVLTTAAGTATDPFSFTLAASSISSVVPAQAGPGETVTIVTANVTAGAPSGDPSRGVQVLFGGTPSPSVDATHLPVVRAVVPDGLAIGAAATVVVVSSKGVASAAFAFQVGAAVKVLSVRPTTLLLGKDPTLWVDVQAAALASANGDGHGPWRVLLAGRSIDAALTRGGGTSGSLSVCLPQDAAEAQQYPQGASQLVVLDPFGRRSEGETVTIQRV